MKQTKILMGMPISVDITDVTVTPDAFDKIFEYFCWVDKKFSPYKKNSDVSLMSSSAEMKLILKLCEQTKKETNGYFDVWQKGKLDPSGLVKGWSIWEASKLIKKMGYKNFYIDAGGDIQANGKTWRVGIKNPFNKSEIIKVLHVKNKGVATSGTYERGSHIYNPKTQKKIVDIVSLTVIGPNIYEADRFATGAFAMGKKAVQFIEGLSGFEGYMIDKNKLATKTTGFEKYEIN